jgi:sugar phosphate isomerase/epimerase
VKLAVSTLGTPGQPLAEAIAIALAGGCDGLELRLHPDMGVHLDMTEAEVAAAKQAIAASGLQVLALAGYARAAAPGTDTSVVDEIVRGLRLADALGAQGLRVFPGGSDTAAAARRIRAALAETPGDGPRVFLETHDEMPTGDAVARVLDAADLPRRTGAIWDILHPWRHGESPDRTYKALKACLGYVQIKDAVSATETVPVLLGTGAVPLRAAGELLHGAGYAGWASLEWERTWYPQVEPVAEVLPGARRWVSEYS